MLLMFCAQSVSLRQNKHSSWPSPDDSLAAAELVHQEGQHGGLLCRRVSLEGLGLQAERQLSQPRLRTVSLHVDLQDLRHVVPVDPHISQVLPQGCLGLADEE